MAKVGIVMGSDSDMPVMAKAAAVLDELGIDYEMRIISAHREPDVFFEYAWAHRKDVIKLARYNEEELKRYRSELVAEAEKR